MTSIQKTIPRHTQSETSPSITEYGEDITPSGRLRLRSQRLVTVHPLEQGGVPSLPPTRPEPTTPFPISPKEHSQAPVIVPLEPGTRLRQERYCLQHMSIRQEWGPGTVETMWSALDAQRSGGIVTICELHLPDCGMLVAQSLLRQATITLTSIGRHPRVPMLWDVFSERNRHFFVFEPVEGESLYNRMRRTNSPLTERQAIECAIQIAQLLEMLKDQSPPLVHGHVRPEHMLLTGMGSSFVLTNYSPILASRTTRFFEGTNPDRLSPYTAPELPEQPVDIRMDLYGLLASIFSLLTGHRPASKSIRSLNAGISIELDSILQKGLHPDLDQRYQSPTMLLAELYALRAVQDGHYNRSGSLASIQRLRQSGVIPVVRPSAQTSQNIPKPQARHTEHGSVQEDLMSKIMEPQLEEISFWQRQLHGGFPYFWVILAVSILLLGLWVLLSR